MVDTVEHTEVEVVERKAKRMSSQPKVGQNKGGEFSLAMFRDTGVFGGLIRSSAESIGNLNDTLNRIEAAILKDDSIEMMSDEARLDVYKAFLARRAQDTTIVMKGLDIGIKCAMLDMPDTGDGGEDLPDVTVVTGGGAAMAAAEAAEASLG